MVDAACFSYGPLHIRCTHAGKALEYVLEYSTRHSPLFLRISRKHLSERVYHLIRQCRPILGNSWFGFFNWLKKLSHKNLKLSRSESFSYVGSHVLGFGGAENDYCQLRNALELLRPHCPESSTAEIHQRYLKVTLNKTVHFYVLTSTGQLCSILI